MKSFAIALSVVLLALAAHAGIPFYVHYQGFLADTASAALDTTVNIQFKIYDQVTGGNIKWYSTMPSVQVVNGLFNVELGPIPDSVFNNPNRFLGVTVGSNSEMTPREGVRSVPFAYRVGTVEASNGGTIIGDVNIRGKANIGFGNTNIPLGTFVAGDLNTASGNGATIGGGFHNIASGPFFSAVAGGDQNTASGYEAFIGGGRLNTASNTNSAVCAGLGNIASGGSSYIGGGYSQLASGSASTISGGDRCQATGDFGTVPGGQFNFAAAPHTFAAGRYSNAVHPGSFVWSDTSDTFFSSQANNSFNIRAHGGAWIFTSDGGGARLPAGQTAWVAISDSTKKNRYGRVDTKSILEKVATLPIETWSYKFDERNIKHIGPMAQDFYARFQVGEDDKGISTLDPDGVALAAIQELAKQNDKLQTANDKLEAEIQELRAAFQSFAANQRQSLLK